MTQIQAQKQRYVLEYIKCNECFGCDVGHLYRVKWDPREKGLRLPSAEGGGGGGTLSTVETMFELHLERGNTFSRRKRILGRGTA